MNDIVKPLTKDGLAGWDRHGQFWIWKLEEGGRRSGSIYADVREKICCICNHGWEVTSESLADQTFLRHRCEYAHLSCEIRYAALKEFDFWHRAILDAGFMFGTPDDPNNPKENHWEDPGLQAIPNEYWPKGDPWGKGKPWYRVNILTRVDREKSKNGSFGRTLKLGSRKHVYHLEIEPGTGEYDYKLAQEILGGEVVYGNVKVTMDIRANGLMIHAHGQEKASEYLKRFAKIMGAEKHHWGLK